MRNARKRVCTGFSSSSLLRRGLLPLHNSSYTWMLSDRVSEAQRGHLRLDDTIGWFLHPLTIKEQIRLNPRQGLRSLHLQWHQITSCTYPQIYSGAEPNDARICRHKAAITKWRRPKETQFDSINRLFPWTRVVNDQELNLRRMNKQINQTAPASSPLWSPYHCR